MKNKFGRKLLSILTTFSLLLNLINPFLVSLAFAQEATITPTIEITPTSTPQDNPSPTTTISVTPTTEISPFPTEIPLPTPSLSLTPSETPSPTSTPSPTNLPTISLSIEPSSNLTPSPTPILNLEVLATASGHLSTTIISNVDSSSTLQLDLTPVNQTDSATLSTNKGDYAPTDTAIISGTNFLANTDYTLVINSSNPPPVNFETQIKTNSDGAFIYSYQLDGNYRPNYKVEIKDASGTVVASTAFTDSLLCTTDVDGVNDEPNQKDLTKMCYDKTVSPQLIKFNWDEIYGGGNNTYDACTLWDTDSDGKANYSLCTSVLATPPTDLMQYNNFTLYSCNDTKSDRCGSPNSPISASGTSCSATQANDDPFSAGAASPQDTVGTCTLNPSNFGSSPFVLLNLCSFPSGQPNSAPADCVGEPTGGFITVIKEASPNDGTAFNFSISGTSNYSFAINGSGQSQRYSVEDGTYQVSETVPSGWGLDNATCADNSGSAVGARSGDAITGIAIDAGDDVTCTFTDSLQQGTLIVRKVVTNDNGGAKTASDFSFQVNSGTVTSFEADGQNDLTVSTGTYSITEPAVTGYTATYDNCTNITVSAGASATCTITNNDIGPTLTVIKEVINNDGGLKTASDFTINVSGTNVSDASFPGAGSPGTIVTLDAGSYSVSENADSGYMATYSSSCSGTISLGENKTCTVTNYDKPGTIIVRKIVTNDNGGTKTAANFSFQVNSGSAIPFESDGENNVLVGAGTYNIIEPAVSGYNTSYDNCSNIVIPNGGSATCTITNDDNVPSLTLDKIVVNDNGGSAAESAWTLTATGPTTISGSGASGSADVVSGLAFSAGTYILSESVGPSGYTPSSWSCTNGITVNGNNEITLGLGQSTMCSITNNDQAGQIKIVKNTVGGDDTFGFTVSGPTSSTPSVTTTAGTGNTGLLAVNAGSYSISETLPSGWDQTGASCDFGTPASFTVANGKTVTCTFTNTKKGHLIVQKTTLPAGDLTSFTITATGSGTITEGGAGAVTDSLNKDYEVTSGTYSIAETVPVGWDKTGDTCQNVVLAAGETKTCLLTNTKRGHVIITKDAIPNNSQDFTFHNNFSNANPDTFLLDDDSNGTLPDTRDFEVLPGSFSVSEDAVTGWKQSNTTCSDGSPINNISVSAGETVTCTFTNKKLGSIVLGKNTIGGNGTFDFVMTGESLPGSVQLITASGSASQTFTNIDPENTYSINETVPVGWDLTSVSCQNQTYNGNITSRDNTSFTVTNGGTVTCTFTNTKRGSISGTKQEVNSDSSLTRVLSDWVIRLFNGEVPVDVQTTDESGNFSFVNVVQGVYTLVEDLLSGWTQIFGPSQITLNPGDSSIDNNFGNFQNGSIQGVKFNDLNGNRQQDCEEEGSDCEYGLPEWTIFIDLNNNGILDEGEQSYSTDEEGNYEFSDLGPGSYSICEQEQEGWYRTKPAESNCETVDIANSLQTSTVDFGNQGRGTIKINKIVDPSNETEWDFRVTGERDYDLVRHLGDGESTLLTDVSAANYTITETTDSNYTTTIDCRDNGSVANNAIDFTVDPGENVECTFTNTRDSGTIEVHKKVDNGSNTYQTGDSGANEIGFKWTLDSGSGHEMGASASATTGDKHEINENSVPGYIFTGWYETGGEFSCANPESTSLPVSLTITKDQVRNITLCNKLQNPILTISKSNDKTGIDLSPGSNVIFTMVIEATQSAALDVSVTDLLPKGFVFRSSSWKVVSSDTSRGVGGDITSLLTAPTYHSPGTWTLGDMAAGEILTLTYIADIDSSEHPGLYKDLAWAQGKSLGGNTVLANAQTTGFVDDNFVGTEVNVVKEQQSGVNINVVKELKQEVLGAATSILPATGGKTKWIIMAFTLFTLGLSFVSFGCIIRRKYA